PVPAPPLIYTLSLHDALPISHDEPAYYSAMFEAGLSHDDDPDLREVAEHSFAVLRRASETLCARLPAHRRPPALMMSLHIWALSDRKSTRLNSSHDQISYAVF